MRRAFTLVELLIVIIIIAVLASIAVPKFANSTRASKEAALRAKLRTVRVALDRHKSDTGYLPWNTADLTLDSSAPPDTFMDSSGLMYGSPVTGWNGPYLDLQTAGIVGGIDLSDPVSGGILTYVKTPGSVGRIRSSATGNAINGTAYSTW
jgi:prepilin-type N-terminal cleavage/methylation domain-containing protein